MTLAGTITAPVTVEYSTAADSALAGSDYTAAAGTLTFEPGGPAQQTVAVPILGDSLGTDRAVLPAAGDRRPGR